MNSYDFRYFNTQQLFAVCSLRINTISSHYMGATRLTQFVVRKLKLLHALSSQKLQTNLIGYFLRARLSPFVVSQKESFQLKNENHSLQTRFCGERKICTLLKLGSAFSSFQGHKRTKCTPRGMSNFCCFSNRQR